MQDTEHDLLGVRRDKLELLREEGIDPFGARFIVSHKAKDIAAEFSSLEKSKEEVSTAGRIITKRGHGKAGFAHIQDISGKLQIYVRLDSVGEEQHRLFGLLDIGDIIGIRV